MSGQPYMKLWISDFLGDTLHLSAEEVGQYMLLLMAMWRNGGYVPADDKTLCRIARGPVADAVLSLCERSADGLLSQKRLRAELEKAKTRSEAARESAKVKWLKSKRSLHADAERTQCVGNANHSQSQLASNDANNNSARPSARDELVSVLDAEHAEAVIEHRKRLRAPLTAKAARQLAKELARAPDPNAAADEMLARGWRGFKAEWILGRNGHGPPLAAHERYRAETQRIYEEMEREADERIGPPPPPANAGQGPH